jgi:hypothetical protein
MDEIICTDVMKAETYILPVHIWQGCDLLFVPIFWIQIIYYNAEGHGDFCFHLWFI